MDNNYGTVTLAPTNDLLFKKMLASEEPKDITQGFIRDFFGIEADLGEINIVAPYSINAYKAALEGTKEGAGLPTR
ncbi:MAG: Rpn family recombination-promoting nuclease/putative transposase [Eubacteriaceae bacterium]|nr:Rpn family recombination-promoting nuclease/putative transposase [Eubacteriaceae bacterium]